ncbi:CobW family GTP-binding protein [Dechloromonas denitrificans]|uniref:CobW family GTP-binding protein n=1 Tax=Dechloromonas denitrificans TaxID=281362 RepID=UPI001CFA0C33|nr:GTP-binding protein [Dechloromonas denitrificans]UCV06072.1 GTP-binding protein [Dechloromonas denitrificans]
MTSQALSPIPVTILSGFLGAGKTTLLNRLLASSGKQRIAVVENEFGAVGIDGGLISDNRNPAITVVELANGCVCCSVRGEMSRALADLADRRAAGTLAFDRLLLETTGLADPAPVAQAFFVDEGVRERYVLDGILTLVDAVHAGEQLDQHRVAAAQVGFADRLLLTKTDLVDTARVEELTARLRRINVRAPIIPSPIATEAVAGLLDLHAFHLDDVLELDPAFLAGHRPSGHARGGSPAACPQGPWDDDVSSLVLRHPGVVDLDRIGAFVEELLASQGNDMLRYKGVLAIADKPERLIFQGVHRITGFDYGRVWEAGEVRESVIVIIGRRLATAAITEAFLAACS